VGVTHDVQRDRGQPKCLVRDDLRNSDPGGVLRTLPAHGCDARGRGGGEYGLQRDRR